MTISGSGAGGTLAGLTITGGTRGILCTGSHPAISRCRILGLRGPGIELREAATPSISHCVIADNQADGVALLQEQGARGSRSSGAMLTNCTIARNGRAGVAGGSPTIANCIIYFNAVSLTATPAAVTYSDIQGGWSGAGNIDADPQFADGYYLKSAAGRWDPLTEAWVQDDVTSPCIDAGDPALPVPAEPTPNGNRINLGAYGGTAEASKSP